MGEQKQHVGLYKKAAVSLFPTFSLCAVQLISEGISCTIDFIVSCLITTMTFFAPATATHGKEYGVQALVLRLKVVVLPVCSWAVARFASCFRAT